MYLSLDHEYILSSSIDRAADGLLIVVPDEVIYNAMSKRRYRADVFMEFGRPVTST
jgi:hypothetical protein